MITILNGRTKVYAIIGYPVEHSYSPAMQNAAFQKTGLNCVYVPFSPRPGQIKAAIEGIRALGLAGANVTVPYKEAVLPFLDELTDEAQAFGAVNTIINREGRLTGHNTDGSGFILALKEDCGLDPSGAPALVLGAGGSARAVVLALVRAGCPGVVLVNRSIDKAKKLADFVRAVTGTEIKVFGWEAENRELQACAEKAGLLVNCTSIGMSGANTGAKIKFPLPDGLPGPGQLAYDLVYNPPLTAFMQRAGQNGAAAANGLTMLLRQGALSFEFWTGVKAPLEVMRGELQRQAGSHT